MQHQKSAESADLNREMNLRLRGVDLSGRHGSFKSGEAEYAQAHKQPCDNIANQTSPVQLPGAPNPEAGNKGAQVVRDSTDATLPDTHNVNPTADDAVRVGSAPESKSLPSDPAKVFPANPSVSDRAVNYSETDPDELKKKFYPRQGELPRSVSNEESVPPPTVQTPTPSFARTSTNVMPAVETMEQASPVAPSIIAFSQVAPGHFSGYELPHISASHQQDSQMNQAGIQHNTEHNPTASTLATEREVEQRTHSNQSPGKIEYAAIIAEANGESVFHNVANIRRSSEQDPAGISLNTRAELAHGAHSNRPQGLPDYTEKISEGMSVSQLARQPNSGEMSAAVGVRNSVDGVNRGDIHVLGGKSLTFDGQSATANKNENTPLIIPNIFDHLSDSNHNTSNSPTGAKADTGVAVNRAGAETRLTEGSSEARGVRNLSDSVDRGNTRTDRTTAENVRRSNSGKDGPSVLPILMPDIFDRGGSSSNGKTGKGDKTIKAGDSLANGDTKSSGNKSNVATGGDSKAPARKADDGSIKSEIAVARGDKSANGDKKRAQPGDITLNGKTLIVTASDGKSIGVDLSVRKIREVLCNILNCIETGNSKGLDQRQSKLHDALKNSDSDKLTKIQEILSQETSHKTQGQPKDFDNSALARLGEFLSNVLSNEVSSHRRSPEEPAKFLHQDVSTIRPNINLANVSEQHSDAKSIERTVDDKRNQYGEAQSVFGAIEPKLYPSKSDHATTTDAEYLEQNTHTLAQNDPDVDLCSSPSEVKTKSADLAGQIASTIELPPQDTLTDMSDKQEEEQETDSHVGQRKQGWFGQRRQYLLKQGDTLESIATKELGDRRLAALVYQINKSTIPAKKQHGQTVIYLQPNAAIWLPAANDIDGFRASSLVDTPLMFEYVSLYNSPEEELAATFGGGVNDYNIALSHQSSINASNHQAMNAHTRDVPTVQIRTDNANVTRTDHSDSQVSAMPEAKALPVNNQQSFDPDIVSDTPGRSEPKASSSAVRNFIQKLSDIARLVETAEEADGAESRHKTALEMCNNGIWSPVVAYEVFGDIRVRHEYQVDGKRRTMNIDLPPAVVCELAHNDLSSNWQTYCGNYLLARLVSV